MPDQTPIVSAAAAQRPLYAGIDVGGTNIKFGIVDDCGRTLAKLKIPTLDKRGPEDAVHRMKEQLERFQESLGFHDGELLAVGLATPGTMDLSAGIILAPPNLPGWRNFPIRDRLRDVCGKPVKYMNDATAAGFGEFWVGSGQDYSSFVLLTLGTGVGAGIIIDGETIDGAHSHGSECGHTIIDGSPSGRICNCGQSGHLEAYASATALVKRTTELLDAGRTSSISQRLAAGDELTTLLLSQEADKGDSLALEIILESAVYLAMGIVNVVHTMDPAAVALGGAMDFGGNDSPLGRRFLETVRQEFRKRTFSVLAQNTVIDFAQLGGDAGYIGAAGMARLAYRH